MSRIGNAALRSLSRLPAQRAPGMSQYRLTSSYNSPAPPRLPKEEQEVFEKLQRESTGAFSTPNRSSDSPASETNIQMLSQTSSVAEELGQTQGEQVSAQAADTQERIKEARELAAVRNGEELHPNVRRGAPPEFEGDVNPKTGESGGPKNEPLRWGGKADWSYNGRVTDF